MKMSAFLYIIVLLFGIKYQGLTCEEVRDYKINDLGRDELMRNIQVCGVDSFDFPLVEAFLMEKLQVKEEFDTLTCGDVVDYIEA